ncbi:MAG: EscU/YscU/HrcU family type III secretion system export apparatus switch protein [Planctomyces sp.]|nr:EscU/YscU/HrcU family type III secretion system export apparatus switch protein [Planctomyces sp.]
MSEQSGQNRTEKATPRRREQARKEGNVAYSSDLTSAAGLVALALLVDLGGGRWARTLGEGVSAAIAGSAISEWSMTHTVGVSRWIGMHVLLAAGIAAFAVLGLTMMTGGLQSGFRFTMQPLQINFSKLSVSRGWGRIFSAESVVRTLWTLCKLTLVTIVAGWAAHRESLVLQRSFRHGLGYNVAYGAEILSGMLWSAAAAMLAIGLADVAWQRYRHEQRLKMTREELKREQKEDSGDPQLKARQRRMQREVAKRKGLKDVASATVVVTNPTHFAVALKYDKSVSAAPIVVAKGTDALARLIIRLAKQADVPVLERKPLARALYKFVEIGKEIPSEFYQAVAEILAFLYRQKRAG